ncbi:hypothetical protein NPX13_g3057 [Xylaria arbuscula]|uniref:DUF7905 domain-containing protein n=1 Tax=Xylaria arbuscula TaxID=114810 RepID=A0A9W8TNK6_9PEZI|nr:hypothetical protein NPX13_g3057 [Xylaria arbuscula]
MASGDLVMMATEQHSHLSPLKGGVSEWSARAIDETTARTDAVLVHNTEPMEFILSSNWALTSEGIEEFYEILYKRKENLEIQYDHVIHGFRVKCSSYDEMRIVNLVKDVLDELVRGEAEKGLERSYKLTSLEDWRKNSFRSGEEPKVAGKYSFPFDVSMCDYRDTWTIPGKLSRSAIVINKMLPESALAEVQQLTGATLVVSSDTHTVYIGAPNSEVIITVKRKLDNLAQYCSLLPRDVPQVVETFFHSEGDRSVKGEYRYVADGNDRFLRGYILDRFDWPHPDQRYPTIFQKGVLIRLNPNHEPWEESKSLANTISPLAKEGRPEEEFGAFTLDNWGYPAKGPVSRPCRSISNDSEIQLGAIQIEYKHTLLPTIESWVSGLPVRDHEKPNLSYKPNIPHVPKAWHKFTSIEGNEEGSRSQSHDSSKNPPPKRYLLDDNDQNDTNDLNTTGIQKPRAIDQLKISANGGQARPGRPIPSLIDFEPIPRSEPGNGFGCPSPVTIAGKGAGNTTENPTYPRSFANDKPLSSVKHKKPQPDEDGPFELLWKQCRSSHLGSISGLGQSKSKNPEIPTAQLIENIEPQVDRDDERYSRSFHTTMNQKAGSRKGQREIFPELDPKMISSITKSLEQLIAPLRMWSGIVDLRIDLGRFYFLNARKSRIQEVGEDDDEKHYALEDIRAELNKRHKVNEKFYFTRVLTSLGAEANDIALMTDTNGNPMWNRPNDGRSSTFEFVCRKVLDDAEFSFIIEIDTQTFTYKIREFKPEQNCFMIYCTKRVWDFRLVLSTSQKLGVAYQHFANELVDSLQVTSTKDRLPELDVSYNKSHNVEILAVRTRNQACCISEVDIEATSSTPKKPLKDTQRLYISEVWEMNLLSNSESEQSIQLKLAGYKDNEHTGAPFCWYEASLKSHTVCTAFEQNEELEFGNEVKWASKDLIQSRAIEQLIKKAAAMIKNMDGVGFWNDNHQDVLLSRVGAGAKAKKGEDIDKYW